MSSSTAAVVAIGDEVISGQTQDTNSFFIASTLAELGISVTRTFSVGDHHEEIVEVLRFALGSADLVFTTGGLGPTTDDITRQAIAEVCGVETYVDQGALQRLEQRYKKRKRKFNSSNTRQAVFPLGAEVIENPLGTADSFITLLNSDRGSEKRIIALPGVPTETKVIVGQKLVPILAELFPNAERKVWRSMRVFGLTESFVGGAVESLGLPEDVTIAYRPQFPELLLRFALPASEVDAEQRLEKVREQVIECLGEEFVYSFDAASSLATVVAKLLEEQGLSVSLYDAGSAGILCRQGSKAFASLKVALSSLEGDSPSIFLGVKPGLIRRNTLANEQSVLHLAKAVRIRSGSDLGLALTSGKEEIYLAIAKGEETFAVRKVFAREGEAFNLYAATLALDLVRRVLQGYPAEFELR